MTKITCDECKVPYLEPCPRPHFENLCNVCLAIRDIKAEEEARAEAAHDFRFQSRRWFRRLTVQAEIRAAVNSGNVQWAASDETVGNMMRRIQQGGRPDFTVTEASLESAGKDYFCVAWGTRSAGFGTLTFYRKGGRLLMDTEAMGVKFCKEVLARLVDQATDPMYENENLH